MTFISRIVQTLLLLCFGLVAFAYGLACYSVTTLLIISNHVLSVWVD